MFYETIPINPTSNILHNHYLSWLFNLSGKSFLSLIIIKQRLNLSYLQILESVFRLKLINNSTSPITFSLNGKIYFLCLTVTVIVTVI